jgi:TrmH family RNA methyltransferase
MSSQYIIEKITSKQNAWYKELREWSQSAGVHKDKKLVWLEGDHLCDAARLKGLNFQTLVFKDDCPSAILDNWSKQADKLVQIPSFLMDGLSSLHSSPLMAAVTFMPTKPLLDPSLSTVVIDQMQDPGNAGSILRSAAAFGFKQIVSTPNTVGLWTHKVVRAAMGAHFDLAIVEGVAIDLIKATSLPIVLTSSHHGNFLDELVASHQLPLPLAWIFGHEGRGHSSEWSQSNSLSVRIRQPGGQESLNVAAAAAICLHASSIQTIKT